MILTCTHCSRTNSADARYCYFDGASLVGAAGPMLAAQKSFLTPFVFPSGQACTDFDQFALGCDQNWDVAVSLLHQGSLQQFFGGMGRMDLVRVAEEAAAFPDRERGLDQLLARLPSKSVAAPKLDVKPKLLNLGTLKVGENRQVDLQLENQGSRLIFGSISCNAPWLAVTESGEARLFQFRTRSTISLHIKGQHLRAGNKPIDGTVFIESNAGTFSVKVVANVPIQVFPDGCLAGSRTPRELAEKAKAFPKDAGALFASGAVARWYQSNGWTYPVQGPASNGTAAVQQFFEALGLSKAPKVYLAEPQIQLHGPAGTVLKHKIQVRSDEPRPVYAHAASTASWCVVKPGQTQGNLVTIPIEITAPADGGAMTETVIRVTSNGQQRFEVPVRVTADYPTVLAAPAPAKPRTKAKSAADLDFTMPRAALRERSAGPGFDPVKAVTHLMPLVLLGFAVMGLIASDLLSDGPKRSQVAVNEEPLDELDGNKVKEAKFQVEFQDEPDEGPGVAAGARFKIDDEPEEHFGPQKAGPVKVEIKDEPAEIGPGIAGKDAKNTPVDPTLRVRYQSGRSLVWGLTDTSTGKRLTFSNDGGTNTTVVRVGGQSVFGALNGQSQKLPDDPAREARERTAYTFSPRPGLRITQILEIVPSKQPVDVGGVQRRLMDTLLVRYLYENIGKQPINAGLRLEIDTLIGSNDRVPFTVPELGLVNTSADIGPPQPIPNFVQALETGNLKSPGTVVHISLKVGGGIEAPARVVLTNWSRNGDLSNIRAFPFGDSAIIMVWPDQNLAAGARREMGYAYGLGSVAVSDGALGVTVGGNFDIGQSFTITAYVNKPVAGQTVSLELPAGLERIKGEQSQAVSRPTVGDTSIVSWEARVLQTGVFPVKVRSSTGVTQTKTITIARGDAPAGGKLSLDLQGSFEPGQLFTVVGKVSEPVKGQTLTLHLPEGLQRIAPNETLLVPTTSANARDAEVKWQVRVIRAGKYPVRVSSSTGIAQTKTITIDQPTRAEGSFQILLTGEFEPGKAFTVSAKVAKPLPNQTLELLLPDGLRRIDGAATQAVAGTGPSAWKVKVEKAGKFTVGVKSTTGVTQRKTVRIEPPGDQPGRFTFDFVGDIRPGKEFKVNALVKDPSVNQSLTLVLPKGLQFASGDATISVPPVNPVGISSLSWTVRVVESGRLPVRIESSTGLARTKTITLSASTLFGR